MIDKNYCRYVLDHILDECEDAGIILPDLQLEVEPDLYLKAASYNPTEKKIKVSRKTAKRDTERVIAHEVCHALALENSSYNLLTSRDLYEFTHTVDNTKRENFEFYKNISDFSVAFYQLSAAWSNTESAQRISDEIESLLEYFQDYRDTKDPDHKYNATWKWLANNYDKVYDSIEYYEVGGHTEEFIEAKNKLESILGIEIPIAE